MGGWGSKMRIVRFEERFKHLPLELDLESSERGVPKMVIQSTLRYSKEDPWVPPLAEYSENLRARAASLPEVL